MIELGRPSKCGIIEFGSGEGSFSTEKNLLDDLIGIDGQEIDDARLCPGAMGFLAQFRDSDTGTFRWSYHAGEVVKTGTPHNGIFWTSIAGMPDGETGISVDGNGPNDKLNIYFASSVESKIIEIRIFFGYM